MSLRARPATLKEANEFIGTFHRHHKAVQGHKFSIAAEVDKKIVGYVVCGRPVARMVDHTIVAEVTRLVTDGSKNVCSFLYSAAARAAKAMGYDKIQTYILEEEPGTSLIAAGWTLEAVTSGGNWNHSTANAGTRRVDQPMGKKQRWSKIL
jgi:hypothetical protein